MKKNFRCLNTFWYVNNSSQRYLRAKMCWDLLHFWVLVFSYLRLTHKNYIDVYIHAGLIIMQPTLCFANAHQNHKRKNLTIKMDWNWHYWTGHIQYWFKRINHFSLVTGLQQNYNKVPSIDWRIQISRSVSLHILANL